ncbi:MFS transporter [Streptomyces sp. NBC_01314]|uniref:MFS transporter n=1 Tax=Streptomyces sp. NBC_01314 TaxID=2903821 RepID=UPI0030883645|nr:MFS transporter [Streptomyces sp. NBC_01314]
MATPSERPLSPDPLRWKALAILAAAQLMVVLDASIVNVALPSVQRDLHFSDSNVQWIVNAYALAFGGFLLLGGRIADLFGRRRVFVTGLALFSVASLVGGLAPTAGWLIAARVGQGLGAAIIAPAALSIVTTTFTEGAERNKALGIWGALAGAGGAIGVLLGGVLTEWAGWEWVMFVNVPIGVAAAFLAPKFVRESRAHERTSLDIAGAALVTVGLSVLVYALVDAEQAGWGSTRTIGMLVLSAVLLGAFVLVELRFVAHPVMPLRIFGNRNVSSANGVSLLVGAALLSMFFFISLYLQVVLGFSALEAGLSYLPFSAASIIAAGVASQLVTRTGPKPVLLGGLALTTVGLLLFTRITPDGTFVGDVLLPSVVTALGLGFSFVPVTIVAVSGVTPQESGLASGLINTTQQIGGALGLAVLSSVANSRISELMAGRRPDEAAVASATTEGFRLAFAVGAGFALLGLLITLLAVPGSDRSASDDVPAPAVM